MEVSLVLQGQGHQGQVLTSVYMIETGLAERGVSADVSVKQGLATAVPWKSAWWHIVLHQCLFGRSKTDYTPFS